MKMRVQGNALRFRMNRREVAEFAASGRASASVPFGGGVALVYSLEQSSAAAVEASFAGGEVRVRVPAAMAREWAEGDAVALSGEQALDGGEKLEILVEKDFQCMHKGEGAQDPEAYPNPFANA